MNPSSQAEVDVSRSSWMSTVPLVAGGSMLEFYEFQTYALYSSVIGNAFFSPAEPEWVRQYQAFGLLSLAFFFRPISGALIGLLGDRFGRKTSFLVTILLMAVPTLGVGLLPGYASIGLAAPLILVLFRIMQGMASAGEMAGAAVYVTEAAPAHRKVFASGTLYGAIHLGYFLAAIVVALISFSMPAANVQAYGWRIAFVLGGVLGLVTLLIRRRLRESPVFEQMKANHPQPVRTPFRQLLRNNRREMVTVMLLGGYVGVAIALVYTYLPVLLETTYKVPVKTMNGIIAASFLVLSIAAIACGRLGDRLGAGRVIAFGTVLILPASAGFSATLHEGLLTPLILFGWYGVMSLVLGSVGCAFALAASQFAAEVRLTGLGISYNLGLAVFLGTLPFVLGFLTHRYGSLPVLFYLWGAAALGLVAVIRTRSRPSRIVVPVSV